MEQKLEKNGSINGINNTAFLITNAEVYKPEVHTMSNDVATTKIEKTEMKANESTSKR